MYLYPWSGKRLPYILVHKTNLGNSNIKWKHRGETEGRNGYLCQGRPHHRPVIPAVWRLRQEGLQVTVFLGCWVTSSLHTVWGPVSKENKGAWAVAQQQGACLACPRFWVQPSIESTWACAGETYTRYIDTYTQKHKDTETQTYWQGHIDTHTHACTHMSEKDGEWEREKERRDGEKREGEERERGREERKNNV